MGFNSAFKGLNVKAEFYCLNEAMYSFLYISAHTGFFSSFFQLLVW